MIGAILLLGLSRAILPGEPPAFQNYFDDSVKGVDISQDSAIKACLQNGDAFADKVKAAYNKCFGNDYDFDDLAGAVGSSDEDSDGLPDSFEGNEACFYEEMGWVAGSGAADADAIKADMAGLDAGLRGDFDANIDACAAWSGSFGSRVRREAVPDLMGSGRAALNWLRSAVRKTRSADPEKEKESGKSAKKNGKKKGTRKSGKKSAKKNGKKKARKSGKKSAKKNGKKKGTRKSGKKSAKKNGKKKGTRKSGKKSAKKNGKKKGTRKSGKKSAKKNGKKKGTRKSGKKSAKKNGKKKGTRKSGKKSAEKNGKKKARKSGKKSAKTNEKESDIKENTSEKKKKKSGKGGKKNSNGKETERNTPKVLDEQTYNKLWCFDLSLEQVLEKCVEEKIKN